MIGQSVWPRDSLDALLRDYERRISRLERRPYPVVIIEEVLLAVATTADIDNPATPHFVVEDGLVHVEGETMTHDAWRSTH